MMHNTTRVLVLGAGSIGVLLASKLAENTDLDVLVGVRQETPSVTLTVSGQETVANVQIVGEPTDVAPVAWVIVATKAHETESLAAWLSAPVCAEATVVVAQNGVDHAARVAPHVPAARVVPLVLTYGAERSAPGQVTQTLDGVVRVPAGTLGDSFADLAAPTTLAVERVEDFTSVAWTKLTWNVVGNALSTLAAVSVRDVSRRPELRELATSLVAEAEAVAVAEGITLSPGLADEILAAFSRYPRNVRSSMAQDRDAGRPFEHETILGPVLEAAERHGLDVPRTAMAYGLLSVLSPKRRAAVKIPALPRVWCAPTAQLETDAPA